MAGIRTYKITIPTAGTPVNLRTAIKAAYSSAVDEDLKGIAVTFQVLSGTAVVAIGDSTVDESANIGHQIVAGGERDNVTFQGSAQSHAGIRLRDWWVDTDTNDTVLNITLIPGV